MNRYYLPSPVSIYQIQNSPKHIRWPFLFHGTQNNTSRFLLGLGASLQHHTLIAWSGPLLPWLAQQKTLLLLKNSTNMQIDYGEDVCVKRDYKNAASLEANLLKFKQNPGKQS